MSIRVRRVPYTNQVKKYVVGVMGKSDLYQIGADCLGKKVAMRAFKIALRLEKTRGT